MREATQQSKIKGLNVLYIVAIESIANHVLRPQISQFMKDLSSSGISFTLLGFVAPEDIKNIHEITDLRRDLMEHNIQTHIYLKSRMKIICIFQLMWIFLKATELVIRKKIHVIQGRNYVNGLIGVILKYLFPVKLIIDWRGTLNEEMVIMNRWKENGIIFRIGMRVEKFVMEKADYVFCVSNAFLNYMRERKIRQSNIDVVPCCPPEAFFLSADKPKSEIELELDSRLDDKFVLVYSGSLSKWNIIEPMLDFFSVVSEKTDMHFLFLTPDVESARKLFKERSFPLEAYTILKVAHEYIASYLIRSDLALLFRERSVINYVASPVKVGEYLACGVPVIGTPYVGDFRRIVSQYDVGFVIELEDIQNNPNLLEKIIKTIKENREEYRKRCRSCARTVFYRRNYINKYIKAYLD